MSKIRGVPREGGGQAGMRRHESRLSRRRLLQGAGLGGAVAIGAGYIASGEATRISAQIDATPPPAPVVAPAGPVGESVADLAASLSYDTKAIFRFVAEEIHYEPYAGILRGAQGTLWARAGNAADQALLLSELLATSQITHRFATGALPADQADALSRLLSPTAEMANEYYQKAVRAAALFTAGVDDLPATPPALTPEDKAAAQSLQSLGTLTIDLASTSAATSESAIAKALAAASVTLPPPAAPALPDREVNRHVWIQIADGPAWIDLDPSVPGMSYGTAAAEAQETLDALPDDWHHALTIGIAAEELLSGTLARRDAVTLQTTSRDIFDSSIALSMASADELSGLGLTINELFTGQKTIFPSIYANGEVVEASQPLIFATQGSTAIGLLDQATPVVGAADGETVAVWLTATITSPDAQPVVVERAVLDRVPAANRASGVIDPAAIAPIRVITNDLGVETIEEFNGLTILQVDVARVPVTYAIARAAVDEVFGEVGVLGPSLAALRDGLGLEHEARAGFWSFPSAPNVTAFTIAPDPADATGSRATVSADLIFRQRTSLPLADVAPSQAIHPLVLSGVLDATAEQLLLDPRIRGAADATSGVVPGPSVGAIFEAAESAGIPSTVLATPVDLGSVQTNDRSAVLISTALESGSLVVLPERPVELDGSAYSGWWIIDPATGRTTDQIQNGGSFAAMSVTGRPRAARLAQSAEYSFLTRAIAWVVARAKILNCIGNLIGVVAAMVGLILAPTLSALAVVFLAGAGQSLRAIAACAAA